MLDRALTIIGDTGHTTAWLAVVGGNARARAFYGKQGWIDAGPFAYGAATRSGAVEIVAHRYERRLDRAPFDP